MSLPSQARTIRRLSLGLGVLILALALPAKRAYADSIPDTDTQILHYLNRQFIEVTDTLSIYPEATEFTVQPFKASLGRLLFVSIIWQGQATGSATVGSASGGGAWGLEFGGAVSINDFPYGGYGGGDGYGAGPGETISIAVPIAGTADTFTEANIDLWRVFTGSEPFSLAYRGNYPGQSPYRITATNIADSATQLQTDAEVTYFYRAEPPQPSVPGPLPAMGAGIAWQWSRAIRKRARGQAGQ